MLILSNNDQNGAHELLRIWGVPKIEILGQIRKVGLRDDTNYLYPPTNSYDKKYCDKLLVLL